VTKIAAHEQPTAGARAQIARENDADVADFALGNYSRAELSEGERRDTVRRQLQAAAKRRTVSRCASDPAPDR